MNVPDRTPTDPTRDENQPLASAQPDQGPRFQCLNVYCGCNDDTTSGPCSEFCSEHGVEVTQVDRATGQPDEHHRGADVECGCGHETCVARRAQGLVGPGRPAVARVG